MSVYLLRLPSPISPLPQAQLAVHLCLESSALLLATYSIYPKSEYLLLYFLLPDVPRLFIPYPLLAPSASIMSAQYDFAQPAKQAYTMDTARLHMASKTPSYIPHGSLQHSSRRMPVESASLPQTSWLSDATEFATSPLSQSYLGVGASVPVDSFLSSSLSDIGAPSYSIHRARSRSRVP